MLDTQLLNGWCHGHENCRLCSRPHSHEWVIFSYFLDSYFFSYGKFGELIMKLSRAALRPLLAAHECGALPLVGAAWSVTARNASHRRSPLKRAEPCHCSERRGVSLRERRATMQVMPGVSLRARWDATLVNSTRGQMRFLTCVARVTCLVLDNDPM